MEKQLGGKKDEHAGRLASMLEEGPKALVGSWGIEVDNQPRSSCVLACVLVNVDVLPFISGSCFRI